MVKTMDGITNFQFTTFEDCVSRQPDHHGNFTYHHER